MDTQHMTANYLVELLHKRKVSGVSQYWLMSSNVFQHIRRLKDEDRNYVYPPHLDFDVQYGEFPPLLGLPVVVDRSFSGIDVLAFSIQAKLDDPVEHPKHYTSHPSGIECIQITEHMTFCLGNAVKYIWRADLKHDDSLEDLRKAKWYIEREIAKRAKRG